MGEVALADGGEHGVGGGAAPVNTVGPSWTARSVVDLSLGVLERRPGDERDVLGRLGPPGRDRPPGEDGATETARPVSPGSAAHGRACSTPVGTTTTGRPDRRTRRGTSRSASSAAIAPSVAVAEARDAGDPCCRFSRCSACAARIDVADQPVDRAEVEHVVRLSTTRTASRVPSRLAYSMRTRSPRRAMHSARPRSASGPPAGVRRTWLRMRRSSVQLLGVERGAAAEVELDLAELGRDAAQLGQQVGEQLVLRGSTDREQRRRAARRLEVGEQLPRPAIGDRQTHTDRRHPVAVGGGVGPQLDGTERGLLLGQQAHPDVDGPPGAPPVTLRQLDERPHPQRRRLLHDVASACRGRAGAAARRRR